MRLGDDPEAARDVQDKVAAQMTIHRTRRAIVPGVVVVMRATAGLVIVRRELSGSLLVTFNGGRRHGDALQWHYEHCHEQKELPKPGRRHVVFAAFDGIIKETSCPRQESVLLFSGSTFADGYTYRQELRW